MCVCESAKIVNLLRLNVVQVDELALQCGGVRFRGLEARFQSAVNLSIESQLGILCSDSARVLNYNINALTDPKDYPLISI